MRKIIFWVVVLFLIEMQNLHAASCEVADIEVSFTPNTASRTMTVSFSEFCPLDAITLIPPFYSVFIEWGDGTYQTMEVDEADGWVLASVSHLYLASPSESLTFDVSVSITPIKSDDDKPSMQRTSMTIGSGPGSPPPITDYVSDANEIDVFSDWNGGVNKGDIITIGIVVNDELFFEDTGLGKGGSEAGQIQLYYNSAYVIPINPRVDAATDLYGRTHPLYFNEGRPEEIEQGSVLPFDPVDEGDAFLLPDNEAYNAKIVWNYIRQQNREIVLFVDFQVHENAPMEVNDYIEFLGFVRSTSEPPEDPATDQNEDGAADPDPLDILASDIHSLKVTPSRDPNKLNILSERIVNDSLSTTLVFQIDFQNEGEGREDNIDIYFMYPPELDISTYQVVEYILRTERLVANIGSPLIQIQKNAFHNGEPAILFKFSDADLLGLGLGLIDPRNSEGRIIFKMKTRTPPACDTIISHAEIIFNDGNDTVKTEKVGVPCVTCDNQGLGTLSPDANYLYWCLVFILALVVFLLAVWLITLKTKSTT